jgi:hypothetical protein
MPDVHTAAMIQRSSRLGTGFASRWPPEWRPPWNAEGEAPFQSEPPVRDHADGLGGFKGLKSGFDFSIGVIRHSPHVG